MGKEISSGDKYNLDESLQSDSMESISDDSEIGNSDPEDQLFNNGICSEKMKRMIKDWEEYMSGRRTDQPSSSTSGWNDYGSNNNNSMADIEGIISKDTAIYTHPESQNALLGSEDLDVNLDLVNIDLDPNNIELGGLGDGDLDSEMKMDDLPDFFSDKKLVYPLYTDDIPYVRPKKYFGYQPSCTITSTALGEIYENVDIMKDDAIKAITAEITGQCTIQPLSLLPDEEEATNKKDTKEKKPPTPMKRIDGFLVPGPVKKRKIKPKQLAIVPPKLPPKPSNDPWAMEIIPLPLKPQQEGQNRTEGYCKKKPTSKNTSVIKQILDRPPVLNQEWATESEKVGIRDYHRDANSLLSSIRLAPVKQKHVEPYKPQEIEPYKPKNIGSYKQKIMKSNSPIGPIAYLEPYKPQNVEPYQPRMLEPAYDAANFGFPPTSYGFSPATSEGFNNSASQAFYNPLPAYNNNLYNPTQYSIYGSYPQKSENHKRKTSSKSSGIIKYADGCVVKSALDFQRPDVPTFNYFSEPYEKIIKRGNKVVATAPIPEQRSAKDHLKEFKK